MQKTNHYIDLKLQLFFSSSFFFIIMTTSEIYDLPKRVLLLPQTKQLRGLMTIIRDRNASRADFIFYADRMIRLLVEESKLYYIQ